MLLFRFVLSISTVRKSWKTFLSLYRPARTTPSSEVRLFVHSLGLSHEMDRKTTNYLEFLKDV
jgi:hypothetical protein